MSRQNTPAIEVQNITVTWRNGHTALRDASFSLPAGQIAALVGVNGSGKSTLFKAIMGFVRSPVGKITLMGLSVRKALKSNLIAYVPQSEEVDWTFPVRVEDVVMMGRYGHMGLLRFPRQRDKASVDAALTRVGMQDYRYRQIGELSGGQKKRVFLARAIAQDGRIILLDEPFTGVDIKSEAQIISLLQALRDEGRTILVSTHDLASISGFCDQAVIIKGTVLASGPLATTFTPANLERAFGGVLNLTSLITRTESGSLTRQSETGETP